jgi:drug/metabolite transporter (DMT)-like permease
MHVLIAAIIASLALIFSHVRKHHFSLNKYAISAIAGSFFFALELTLSKSILSLYSPISFYLIRCTGIFLFSLIIFKPHIEKIKPKVKLMVTGVGIIWILYRILLYMSYQSKGLITTTLLFILAPIFIYTLSYFYLREKLNLRNIIASVIIVLCVVYAMFYSIVSTN